MINAGARACYAMIKYLTNQRERVEALDSAVLRIPPSLSQIFAQFPPIFARALFFR